MAGTTATAVADTDGRWSTQLPARAAGGPYRLIVHASNGRVQTLDDVLVGDVYLCSGQSNMELPVHRTLNAPAEIDAAANDRIRMLTVPHRATRSGDGVTVQFNGLADSLLAYGHSAPIGFGLCGPEPGPCRYADATLRDRRVLLRAENVEAATRVRYCWADSPVCALYDGARLPATPFEVTISGDDPE